jgi:hypothetical protein
MQLELLVEIMMKKRKKEKKKEKTIMGQILLGDWMKMTKLKNQA